MPLMLARPVIKDLLTHLQGIGCYSCAAVKSFTFSS
jgi:hypothetical protein